MHRPDMVICVFSVCYVYNLSVKMIARVQRMSSFVATVLDALRIG